MLVSALPWVALARQAAAWACQGIILLLVEVTQPATVYPLDGRRAATAEGLPRGMVGYDLVSGFGMALVIVAVRSSLAVLGSGDRLGLPLSGLPINSRLSDDHNSLSSVPTQLFFAWHCAWVSGFVHTPPGALRGPLRSRGAFAGWAGRSAL